jgi:hypothetical protein
MVRFCLRPPTMGLALAAAHPCSGSPLPLFTPFMLALLIPSHRHPLLHLHGLPNPSYPSVTEHTQLSNHRSAIAEHGWACVDMKDERSSGPRKKGPKGSETKGQAWVPCILFESDLKIGGSFSLPPKQNTELKIGVISSLPCYSGKNWMHTVCTGLSCVYVLDEYHMSSPHDPTTRIKLPSLVLYGPSQSRIHARRRP